METIIVSACLLGENTKYNGKNNYDPRIEKIKENYDIIPVCPEVFGGMSIPREPSELIKGLAYSKSGKDVNNYFVKGANSVVNIAKYMHVRKAILMDRSPSCGVKEIYDGYFTSRLIPGEGFTTSYLKKIGVECYTLDDFISLFLSENKDDQE